MAKKGYPGLVLVPPSDRTILRRRLAGWSLFIIAVLWGAWTTTGWPPLSNDTVDCQTGVGQNGADTSAEKCRNPQSEAAPQPNLNEFSLTQLSQAEGLAEPHNSVRVPILERDHLPIQHNPDQDSKTKSADQASHPSDHPVAAPVREKSTASQPAGKPVSNSETDTRLAEQGDAFAQYRLGRYYAQQGGQQAPEAVSWYKKSSQGLQRLAESGNGQAMYVLGVMYAYGRGVARNTEQARRWLTQAVERKVTAAQPVLANLEVHSSADPKLQVNAQSNR
jgi:uncharacterized protein